ncbi:hypothetical protein N657DRAFT_690712 [Parathielavia appendiculata]|uniref:Serine hydrolase domain-containing protein n=1 Tax=Parathielavia appendiculata TaxID=2587402 RepID=A0AAN6TYE7_9PEZI|nr:hypothetical protein N657DRAFT_690712 [Parathielavia appendiculata]
MKPKLLFLHGSGTNASIFRIQSRKLAHLLKPHFDLLYFDAPIPCDPGPGVLPFFEGCGPYLTWMDDVSGPRAEEAYYEGDAIRDLAREVEQMRVVGIVGFSMGAKVAMGVVRLLEAEGGANIRVVAAVCGTVPFQGGYIRGLLDEAREKAYQGSLVKGVVQAESVHLIGDGDPWRVQSEKLVGFFAEEGRRVIRFEGEHHMPADDAVNREVAMLILAAVDEICGWRMKPEGGTSPERSLYHLSWLA